MISKEERREALEVAIARAGGIVAFAKAMGVTHQAVTAWRKKACMPLQRAVVVESLTGVARQYLIDPSLLAAMQAPAGADVI